MFDSNSVVSRPPLVLFSPKPNKQSTQTWVYLTPMNPPLNTIGAASLVDDPENSRYQTWIPTSRSVVCISEPVHQVPELPSQTLLGRSVILTYEPYGTGLRPLLDMRAFCNHIHWKKLALLQVTDFSSWTHRSWESFQKTNSTKTYHINVFQKCCKPIHFQLQLYKPRFILQTRLETVMIGLRRIL